MRWELTSGHLRNGDPNENKGNGVVKGVAQPICYQTSYAIRLQLRSKVPVLLLPVAPPAHQRRKGVEEQSQ